MDLIALAIFVLGGISAGVFFFLSRGLEQLRGRKD